MSIQLYSSPMKYKDPNTGNYTNIIGISGNPGRGIASVELNNDYTLTLTFTDGTSTTTPSIRGNGIESIEKTSTSGLIDTYTITDSDSNTYTFEVTNGDVPNLTIGTVTEGEEASATITGSRENPVLNLVLPLPSLTDYVKKTDYANGINTGVIRVNNNYGLTNVDASDGGVGRTTYTAIMAPTTTEIRTGADRYKPIVPRNQHEASFYGLAKAAGDTTQAQSSNAVGTYTASAKAAIQAMLDVPSKEDMQAAIADIGGMEIHICTAAEYDAQTGIPTIQNPDSRTFYLVPGGETPNLYIEWVYTNGAWEQFGSASVDLSGYATKEEVPVEYTDKEKGSIKTKDITVGANVFQNTSTKYASFSSGLMTTAAGVASHAEGSATNATGDYSHAEGNNTIASGAASHTEGSSASAIGHSAHAEGSGTIASANYSHAEGYATVAKGEATHVEGSYNVIDTLISYPTWAANTQYEINDKVIQNNKLYKCINANSDATWKISNWKRIYNTTNFIHITGNGESQNRSNAYALDWDGNGHYMGDVYVHANADSTGGTKLATVEDIPDAPVQDVQVNGTSVVNDGVANVPIANASIPGVVIVDLGDRGLAINALNKHLEVRKASAQDIKSGINAFRPIVSLNQHESTFYGLAKAAGDTTQSASSNAVGTYTPEAKSAIQHMLGTDTILAPNETNPFTAAHAVGELFTANGKLYQVTAAVAIGDAMTVGTNCAEVSASGVFAHDVQVNGTSVMSNGVANVPLASTSTFGAVKIWSSGGLYIANNMLCISRAQMSDVKPGTNSYKPITPANQHESTFYGLAKAAGDTTQSASSNAVGTYTDNAKASIKSMLGIVDGSTSTVSVTGTTPSITAVENTRYTCGEVSTLTITPPASGICIVRFTSGTTPTVLTATGVVWPAWFDATDLEADTTYEICITDGYGAVMSWAL